MEKLLDRISPKMWRIILLTGLALLVWLTVYATLKYRINVIAALPIVAVMGLLVLYNYKLIFYLLIFCIPWSLHLELGGGLAMDIFTEPLMLVFLAVFLVEFLAGRQFSLKKKVYPFHVLIFLILFWTFFTTLTSEIFLRSFKFLLAKVWYLCTFVYIAERVITSVKDIKRIFWLFFIPMVLVSLFISIKHATFGFSFEESNSVPNPLFVNGVIYAATLALFTPWAFFARNWYSPKTLEWYLIHIGLFILIMGVVFAYKRGAWLAVGVLPFVYLLIKRKLFDKVIYAGLIVLFLGLTYLLTNNNYYYFAPSYRKTIFHEGDLEGHLTATFEGREISAAERFYRWVAAKNMVADMPWVGSGPSTFNKVYQGYTDDAFKTYVSDNEEESTTHNYFLMTFAEQGFIGGTLFGFLTIFMLLRGYHIYHRLRDPTHQNILMMVILGYCTILFHSLLNELIEVDKIGSMFWLSLVIIHKFEVWDAETAK
ncbi:MAG: O-antigen ligase family protein [Bacteroidota bacterium]